MSMQSKSLFVHSLLLKYFQYNASFEIELSIYDLNIIFRN